MHQAQTLRNKQTLSLITSIYALRTWFQTSALKPFQIRNPGWMLMSGPNSKHVFQPTTLVTQEDQIWYFAKEVYRDRMKVTFRNLTSNACEMAQQTQLCNRVKKDGTTYNMDLSASLPDELNAFHAWLKDSNTFPAVKLPADNNSCSLRGVLTIGVLNHAWASLTPKARFIWLVWLLPAAPVPDSLGRGGPERGSVRLRQNTHVVWTLTAHEHGNSDTCSTIV